MCRGSRVSGRDWVRIKLRSERIDGRFRKEMRVRTERK
jgi:hypothetical protein